MKATSIEERKAHVESILQEERKQIVIVMDDIDRLERDEVHAVFRLIKLTGNFPFITYLLAFDQERVAAAIGTRFGTGDLASGRSFL